MAVVPQDGTKEDFSLRIIHIYLDVSSCRGGGIGRREGLKILWDIHLVRVQVPPSAPLLYLLMKDILVLLTGGTIDSHRDEKTGNIIPLPESAIPNYSKKLKLYTQLEFIEICMKDSRDINLKDLQKMIQIIEKDEYSKILVTHGTYTMSDTARYLQKNVKGTDKTIVLTGSMTPLNERYSDADFNLGYALSQLSVLSPGIFVCMNGKTFLADAVEKDVSAERFVAQHH